MVDFFQGQESLSALGWIIRSVITFLFLLITVKIMGQRSISQMRFLDFLVALMLGNIIAHPLSDPHIGLKGALISTVVIVIMYIFGIFLTLRFPRLRQKIDSVPFPLIKDGKIIYEGLKKARISIDYLLSVLRKEKIEDVNKVALALWESGGEISIFPDPKYEPMTPATNPANPGAFELPRIVIKEGKIQRSVLQEIDMKEAQLINRLKSAYQAEVTNVLLGTVDSQKKLSVFLYK
ncbi:DUF421 domain-containing protein [Neobacillus mesonae]|uniref:DUF421 domain-containing protein n=1 Tax=Neobacillus mesonae TaxID=1193713 RepID=UPI00203CDCE3|nr:YetF domain-containing protein [Neobacillus mesonae]MCM3568253.1 DUF421 domain-containing protein [Neobacillus mesonae]